MSTNVNIVQPDYAPAVITPMTMVVTWPHISYATGYTVYKTVVAASDYAAYQRRIRMRLNKRKKQRRQLTGRRK